MKARATLFASMALFIANSAIADDVTRKACVEATEKGQTALDESKFSAAREQFLICSASGCPPVIAKQCTEWMAKLDADQPSVAFRARDAAGKDVTDVRVMVDGERLTDTLDGKAINVEPGVHIFKYMRDGSLDVEEKLVVRIGEKNRFVDVTFAPPKPITPESADRLRGEANVKPPRDGFHVPAVAWITGAVGLAAFGGMTALAIVANSDETSLRTSCAPRCAQSDVDAIQAKLTIANVAMAVGFVGVAVAVTSIIIANVGGGPKQSGAVQLRLRAGAGWAGLSGSF